MDGCEIRVPKFWQSSRQPHTPPWLDRIGRRSECDGRVILLGITHALHRGGRETTSPSLPLWWRSGRVVVKKLAAFIVASIVVIIWDYRKEQQERDWPD